jgi:hypothetical protein
MIFISLKKFVVAYWSNCDGNQLEFTAVDMTVGADVALAAVVAMGTDMIVDDAEIWRS